MRGDLMSAYLPNCITTSMDGCRGVGVPPGGWGLILGRGVGSAGATWGEHWLACRAPQPIRNRETRSDSAYFLYLSPCNFPTHGDLARTLPPRILLFRDQPLFWYFCANKVKFWFDKRNQFRDLSEKSILHPTLNGNALKFFMKCWMI